MNKLLAAIFIALALAPAASAGPGHGGPIAWEQNLYVHLVDGEWALHPSEPLGEVLPEAHVGLPTCGNAFQWQAAFTQAIPDYNGTPSAEMVPGLARNASFDVTRPTLVWFLEAVNPVTGGANTLPLPETLLQATLRTGSDTTAWQDGEEIAGGSDVITPVNVPAGDKQVYKYELKLDWQGSQELAPGTELQLEVRASFGPEQCRSDFPGIRPYSAEGVRPEVTFWLFDPVRADVFTVDSNNGTVVVDLVIRSPWGTEAITVPNDAIISGPTGPVAGVERTHFAITDAVELQWTWHQGNAPNATYRVDIAFADFRGDAQITDWLLFDVQGPVVEEEPKNINDDKDSPGLGLVGLIALLGVAVRLGKTDK